MFIKLIHPQFQIRTERITVRMTRGVGHLTFNLADMWGYFNCIFRPKVGNLTAKYRKIQISWGMRGWGGLLGDHDGMLTV